MGSRVLVQLRQRQLLTQVLSFCEEASEGEKGEEGEERRREGGGGGQQEGGRRENAEVLKGTLTSFLGFPWQPNIPQMNISVREREEAERGEGCTEMEAGMEGDGRHGGREVGTWRRGDRGDGGGEREARRREARRWRLRDERQGRGRLGDGGDGG